MINKDIETTRQVDGSGFWTPARSEFARKATHRLIRQQRVGLNSDLLVTLNSRLAVSTETLLTYGCGVDPAFGYDWLTIPYKTGINILAWINGRMTSGPSHGSAPGESFFGSQIVQGGRNLFITETALEAMLLYQRWASRNGDDVVTILNQPEMSDGRKQWLKENIRKGHWQNILLLCGRNSPLQSLADDPWYWVSDDGVSYRHKCRMGVYPRKIVVNLAKQTGGLHGKVFHWLRETPDHELRQFLLEISDNFFDGSE